MNYLTVPIRTTTRTPQLRQRYYWSTNELVVKLEQIPHPFHYPTRSPCRMVHRSTRHVLFRVLVRPAATLFKVDVRCTEHDFPACSCLDKGWAAPLSLSWRPGSDAQTCETQHRCRTPHPVAATLGSTNNTWQGQHKVYSTMRLMGLLHMNSGPESGEVWRVGTCAPEMLAGVSEIRYILLLFDTVCLLPTPPPLILYVPPNTLLLLPPLPITIVPLI